MHSIQSKKRGGTTTFRWMPGCCEGLILKYEQIEKWTDNSGLPGHTENLNKWKELAVDTAAGGLIIADVAESFEIKGCRAVS